MVTLRINMFSLIHNIGIIRMSTSAKLCAVVKANAYGHGLSIAQTLEEVVDAFAVSTRQEAVKLYYMGISKPIFILSPVTETVDYPNFVYTVTGEKDLACLKGNGAINVSIAINTGMNRLGVRPIDADKLYRHVQTNGKIEVISAFTHFYNAQDKRSVESQFDAFEYATCGMKGIVKHCCASNCLTLDSKYHLDMVRCGLAMYGYGDGRLLPAMSAYTEVAQVITVRKGEHVGYGQYLATRDMKVATLKVGYADGLRRCGSVRYVTIKGERCRLIGQSCMDMSFADVSGIDVKEGDRAYLIDNHNTAQMLADAHDTIVYEVLTSFCGERIRRIYD